MASLDMVAIREEKAKERIDTSAKALTRLLKVRGVDWERRHTRYPEESIALHLELIADVLEDVAAKAAKALAAPKPSSASKPAAKAAKAHTARKVEAIADGPEKPVKEPLIPSELGAEIEAEIEGGE